MRQSSFLFKLALLTIIGFTQVQDIFGQELPPTDTRYLDTFCVAVPKPLWSDSINWNEERDSCIALLRQIALEKAHEAWLDSVANLIAYHMNQQKCLAEPFSETFTVEHLITEHHYTLYYYDQAGNLVQTIPPAGVVPLGEDAFPLGVWDGSEPDHMTTYITRYQYNSAEQVVAQRTPNAGESQFIYDRAQRLRFSQNAEQSGHDDYAYTKYDPLSRILEVGELLGQVPDADDVGNQAFPEGTEDLQDVVYTQYDVTTPPGGVPSNNTRNRVASIENENITSYYDYDAHGNVRELTHVLKNNALDDETISIQYDYDLISGNVNELRYEPAELDQMTQRYLYDADNRLLSAFSSDDGSVFDEDGRYFYYLHGPLARVELGEDKIQGMDYYYTLQGWIKGVNSPPAFRIIEEQIVRPEPGQDAGQDATTITSNKHFAADAMAYALGYHDVDYTPIGGMDLISSIVEGAWNGDPPGYALPPVDGHTGLFNGNIAWTLNFSGNGLKSFGTTYTYDALHRILSSSGSSYNLAFWSTPTAFSTMSYDPNGNLKTLSHDDFDVLTYHYDALKPNTLDYVDDAGSGDGLMDQSASNYGYDEIGNITSDVQAGTTMTWDVYGKLRSVVGSGLNNAEYRYDTQGNRLRKRRDGEFPDDVYIRDASGNLLALYQRTLSLSGDITDVLKEQYLYGSSRIATLKPDRLVHFNNGDEDLLTTNSRRQQKAFELSNHLGNVFSVVSDKKSFAEGDGFIFPDQYLPEYLYRTDYYPFGLNIEDLTEVSSESYRFGFNGKEKDDAISSVTNYDYGFRIYNPAIGRFLSVDPLTANYPWYTPYQFAGNTPIWAFDIDGLEEAFGTDYYDELEGVYKRVYTLNSIDNIKEEDIGMIQFKYSDGSISTIQQAQGSDLDRIVQMRETKHAYDLGQSDNYIERFRIRLQGPTTAEQFLPSDATTESETTIKTVIATRVFTPVTFNGKKIVPGVTINEEGLPFAFGSPDGDLPDPGTVGDRLIQKLAVAISSNTSISKLTLEGTIGRGQPGLAPMEDIRLLQSMQHGFTNLAQRLRQLGVPASVDIDYSGSNVRFTSGETHSWQMIIE